MSFSKDIDSFIRKTEAIQLAVVQKSAEELAIEANTDYNSGGHLPIDTAFLRNSIAAGINSRPSGPSERPNNYQGEQWKSGPIAATISQLKMGDQLYIGWTAEYAIFMESRFGFARKAVQNWQSIVNRVATQYRGRINAN